MAGAGRQPPGRLRGPLAPAARPELLHDRLGGARVERGRRARAARRRPGAPALPVRRVLSGAGGAGRRRRHARHHARRRRRRGRADRRRTAQGVRTQGARDPSDDVHDRVASPACGRHGARRRPRDTTRRVEPVEAGRDRALLLRRRLAEPRDGAGCSQHERADRVPGPPAPAPLSLRGQRARDQRAEPRRMGGVGADGSEGAALRDRLRPRSRRGARHGDRARGVGARAAETGGPAPALRALPQPCGRRCGDGVSHAAGDPRRLREGPDPRDGALARLLRPRDGRGARGRLPGCTRRGARARARGRGASADDLGGAGDGAPGPPLARRSSPRRLPGCDSPRRSR